MTRTYVCPDCGSVFVSPQKLAAHVRARHRSSRASPVAVLVDSSPPNGSVFVDYAGFLPRLEKLVSAGINVLIIGPKGVGKTALVRELASRLGRELFEVNLSLRTRESHLIGSVTVDGGSVRFVEGIVVRAMRVGGILYLDELNAAEPDVLIRLNEVLDDRRQLVIKEAVEPIVVRAHPNFVVIATINPLSHVGAKELPQQILSRFPVRLYIDYPPEDVEYRIVLAHVWLSPEQAAELRRFIELANVLRSQALKGELPYAPSLRESIAFARLLALGFGVREAAELTLVNVYYQYGPEYADGVKALVSGKW